MTTSTPESSCGAATRADKARNGLKLLAKIAVAALLIGWLLHSHSLDLGALRVLVTSPWVFVANLAAWLICSVVLSTWRWKILLRIAGVDLPLWLATRLQMTALFFNVVVPGNIGGDLIKALTVARDSPKQARTPILLMVLVERVLGLSGLIATGVLIITIRYSALSHIPKARPILAVMGLLAVGCILMPAIAVWMVRLWGDQIRARISDRNRITRLLGQLVDAARITAGRPGLLLAGLLLSMGMHATAMGYFTLLSVVLNSGAVDYGLIAAVFPLGLLTVVLPISPAGLGVGHVAFDQLYSLVGLTGGATVFNVFLLGQIAPAVFCIIPYLTLRRRSGGIPTTTA